MKRYVIIVAAGRGSRMQSPLPKQFLRLNGTPVILYSIRAFTGFDPKINLILVLPGDQIAQWEKIAAEYNVAVPVQTIAGGETRFESVKNGLSLIPDEHEAIVAVHDAARPLVGPKTISAAFNAAVRYGNAVPAVPLSDSIRKIEAASNVAVDRSRYCVVQTPQCFQVPLLKRAYEQEYKYTFTDDATVVELMGEQIYLVDGNEDNFKLTTPMDLVMAEALLQHRLNHTGDLSGGTHP